MRTGSSYVTSAGGWLYVGPITRCEWSEFRSRRRQQKDRRTDGRADGSQQVCRHSTACPRLSQYCVECRLMNVRAGQVRRYCYCLPCWKLERPAALWQAAPQGTSYIERTSTIWLTTSSLRRSMARLTTLMRYPPSHSQPFLFSSRHAISCLPFPTPLGGAEKVMSCM